MANFTYNLGIPDANNDPSVDQPDMKINTDSVDGWVAIDHIGFNANNGGWHNVIHFNPQSGTPVSSTGGLLYTQSIGGQMTLLFESQTGTITPLTNTTLLTTNGFTRIPGGLLMQWGQVNPATSGTLYSFPTAFSAAPYSLQITMKDNSTNSRRLISYNTTSATQFIPIILDLNATPQSVNISWIAIGPQ